MDKKNSGGTVKSEPMSNKELAEVLDKPVIRTFKKGKLHSSFIDNIWGTDLADMFIKGFRFLLCVIDIYSKYAWVIPYKKGITVTNGFQKFLDESKRRPSKIWEEKDSEFYNRSSKSFFQNNDIELYSMHHE